MYHCISILDTSDLISRLAQHRTLAAAPEKELAWLAAHGRLRHIEPGDVVSSKSEPLLTLVIVLSGHFAIWVDRGSGPHKVTDWRGGDVSGTMPYSRMGKPPGDAVADEAGDLVLIDREHFPEMIAECPTVTTKLVHLMLDRVRTFQSSDLLDEKLLSLGRMSAGLAHELNNPASAATRSAKLLINSVATLEDASRALGAVQLSETQLATVNQSRKACLSALPAALSPIERADREEAISEWLEAHGADASAAGVIVDTAVTIGDLDTLSSVVEGSALNAILKWLAADCSTRTLAKEVEKASARIHDLVAAMKRSSFMDRTAVPEPVDLKISLSDAVALLLHKARRKSASVILNIEPTLPRALAIGGDLSQIWINLIDNAIDAIGEAGHVTINTAHQLKFVVVNVIDDGPGIPPEVRERIFEPFFTTKPPGQGTGQGLDIARQLIRRNGGDIEVRSRPGYTEFRVTLPAAPTDSKPAV
jgi:signal transduction histidine kinase